MALEVREIKERLEPAKSPMDAKQMGEIYSNNPRLLAWRDCLRTVSWEEMFQYPSVSLQQMRQLLAIVA